MKKKILFVCLGNICRSSTAEGVMLHLIREAGLEDQFMIDSAGILAYHQGELPDSRMRAMQLAEDMNWFIVRVRSVQRTFMTLTL